MTYGFKMANNVTDLRVTGKTQSQSPQQQTLSKGAHEAPGRYEQERGGTLNYHLTLS